MSDSEIYLLEWTFSPADYFKEAVEFSCDLCTIRVDNGKAEVRILPAKYPADHSARYLLHAELDARFMGAQVLSHKPYSLSKPSVTRLHADGRRDTWAFPEAGTVTISVADVDFILTGEDGQVIRDTKRERIGARVHLSQLAAKYITEPVANSVIRSYAAAVNDPQNELVHLYEVRDALSQFFGGQAAACSATGVSSTQWSRLGHLANDEPFTQGRHRGKQLGSVRDASASELSEARNITRAMVEGYLLHLSNKNP